MHLSLIQEGEELEKKANIDSDEQHELATWLYLNHKELLEAARLVAESDMQFDVEGKLWMRCPDCKKAHKSQ